MNDPRAVHRHGVAGSSPVRAIRAVQLLTSVSAAVSLLSVGIALGEGSLSVPMPGSSRSMTTWAADSFIATLSILRVGLMFGAVYWVALILAGLAVRLFHASTVQTVADRVTPSPVRRMIDGVLVR